MIFKNAFFTSLLLIVAGTSVHASESSLVEIHVLRAPAPAAIDGKSWLFYELIIENRSQTTEVEIQSLRVDAGAFGGKTLTPSDLLSRLKYLGSTDYDTLPDWLNPPAKPASPLPGHLPPGKSTVIFLEWEAPLHTPAPAFIFHYVEIKGPASASSFELKVPIDHQPAVVLGSPFNGGVWFPSNSPGNNSPHRRSILRLHGLPHIAQRFAIDWMRIGSEGRLLYSGTSPLKNTSYYSYGEAIYAVADATIQAVTDDLDENTPDPKNPSSRAIRINEKTVAGNAVILDLGHKRFALYAHLQPGRIQVKAGDRVRKGQLIGFLGNSGNSTAPHLHLHVCDGPSALACEGVPYVFEEFTHGPVRQDGLDWEDSRVIPTLPAEKVSHELTWTNQEIEFPQAR